MLDSFTIVSKGGLVLWSKNFVKLQGTPLDTFIKTVVLEERQGQNSYTYNDKYTLKWTFANEFGLIFVAVYQKFLQLLFIEDLLESVKTKFCASFRDRILKNRCEEYKFEQQFLELLAAAESRAAKAKQSKQQQVSNSATATRNSTKYYEDDIDRSQLDVSGKLNNSDTDKANGKLIKNKSDKVVESSSTSGESDSDDKGQKSVNTVNNNADADRIKAKIPVARGKNMPRGKGGKKTGKQDKADTGNFFSNFFGKTEESDNKGGKPKPKKPRRWNDEEDEEVGELDFSKKDTSNSTAGAEEKDQQLHNLYKASGPSMVEQSHESDPETDTESEPEVDNKGKSTGKRGYFSSLLRSIPIGTREITDEDLQPVLSQMKDNLLSKNVAAAICDQLCDSVKTTLVGQKLGSFQRLKSSVDGCVSQALERVLSCGGTVDVVREVMKASAERRVFKIVCVGVNGVGKSTSLAKLCYWLQSQGFKCMICACDTFRSGAVEQLRVHAKCLNAPLFEKGYGKDAASIAMEGIKHAQANGIDVVLIDTAGRMQDNEPLMRSLSKLINLNKPDLTLFVGEALVGNDAVDQLTKFNQALADLSTESNPRLIDGIVLTKFDTIDEKVGAAVSMVYTTGKPILFVGVGQTYTDLKKLNVKTIVRSLLH